MQMLGPRSVSAFLGAAMAIASVLLWICLACLVAAASAYAGAMIAIHAGWIEPGRLHFDRVKIEVDDVETSLLAWPVVAGGFVGALIALPATIVIVRRLKQVLNTFILNDPFRAENGEHLRVIAVALIVIQLSDAAKYYIQQLLTLIVQRPEHGHFSVTLSLSSDTLMFWFVIAMLFVLAAVFREGARLRDEQSLTV